MEALSLAYQFMTEVTLPVNGYEITLWQLFLFFLVAGILIWFLRKFFLD